ncbi:retron St85 family effector protein [Cardiobacterium sp. Marseille-Q4385]|jgi:hypothetical protein|uniref:retron St85 family effector protein n=1 Tax=Cardiobacterium sp. Marseille-Q4385 TaxID=2866573 RepID=UPI001CE3D11E|nr:retron St85 family effector protein [Cardiobacterium sp. Marseille-Q4385]
MQEDLDRFINMIDPLQTHIKGKLPFIWVFGNGAEQIKRIGCVTDEFHPTHLKFSLYRELSSNRAKFFQWSLYTEKSNELTKLIRIPEQYPEWESYRSQYTNLVDFELDVISISQGAIIFSESIGAHVEIGMLSCLTELHQNILIVVDPNYIGDNCHSFFNLGAIEKIRENRLDNITNVWAFENIHNNEKLSDEFRSISDHMLNIITTDSKMPLSAKNKSHISLLLLDLIDLFPNNCKLFYRKALEKFEINIQPRELKNILFLLKLLGLITEHPSGKNEKLKTFNEKYLSCINYQKGNKIFKRADFVIERSKK